jgi:hypothetical protein
MPQPESDFRVQWSELIDLVNELRTRLRPLLSRLLPAGSGPRSCGRALRTSLGNGFRCWTVAHTTDPAVAIRSLPGRRGWEQILAGLSERGATRPELADLRKAIEAFESAVHVRGLRRANLRASAAGGLDSPAATAAMRRARAAAHRSSVGIYGVGAKSMICAAVIGPSPGPSPRSTSMSIGFAGVFDGLERNRPGLAWPILRRSAATPDSRVDPASPCEALGDDRILPSLIAGVSTRGIAGRELRPGSPHGFETIDLADVSADRNGELRFAHAEILRDRGSLPDGEVLPGCMAFPMLVPVESLVADLLVHRRFAFAAEPAAAVFGTSLQGQQIASWNDCPRVPIDSVAAPVPSLGLPRALSPLDAAYFEAIGRVVRAQGATLEEYRIDRLLLSHPPLHSTVAFLFELGGEAKRPQ